MNLSLSIARRYLLSKKRVSAINIISAISVVGVTLSAAAMLCTLSVFNGFEEMVQYLFTGLDPELKIVSTTSKTFDAESICQKLDDVKDIKSTSLSLEENVIVRYKQRQLMATLKGVDDKFRQTVSIDSILLGEGSFILDDGVASYGIPGIGLASNLGTGVQFVDPLEIYAPRNDASINIANPATAFRKSYLHSQGLIFMVNQDKYDDNYLICDLGYAQKLMGYEPAQASSIAVSLVEGANLKKAKKNIQEVLSDMEGLKVLDRYEQQEDVYKIMELEKMMSYLFLTFILLVASFNIIGSLNMLIVDKKEDIATLRALGASRRLISRIFLLEGWMISLIGAVLGVLLGLLLAFLQQSLGLISLGSGFIIEDYPVSVHLWDVVLVLLTVAVTGLLSVLYPVRYTLGKDSGVRLSAKS